MTDTTSISAKKISIDQIIQKVKDMKVQHENISFIPALTYHYVNQEDGGETFVYSKLILSDDGKTGLHKILRIEDVDTDNESQFIVLRDSLYKERGETYEDVAGLENYIAFLERKPARIIKMRYEKEIMKLKTKLRELKINKLL